MNSYINLGQDGDDLFDHYTNGDMASDISEEEGDLGLIMNSLYKDKKYYQILTILPSVKNLLSLRPNHRLLLSLTLFRLGRYDGSLRQLAIAIESEPNFNERVRYLNYLIRFFKILNIKQTELVNLEIKQIKYSRPLLTEINPIEGMIELGKVENLYVPIHQQANDYLQCGGHLHEVSLARFCIMANSLNQHCHQLLNDWRPSKPLDHDPLKSLYESLKLFPPLYLYNDIDEKLIKSFIEWEISQYQEIDLSMSIPNMINCLKSLHKHSPKTFISLVNMIIKTKMVLGFLLYLSQDYKQASNLLIWIITFISMMQRKFPWCINKTEYLTLINRRICCIYLSKCIDYGNLEFKEEILEITLGKLINDGNINVNLEFFNNRLSLYFIACGIIYEKISYQQREIIKASDDLTIERWDQPLVGEMLRKYIIASTYTPLDDSSILEIFDRIIWGLLIYGGIHLQTIWFFQNLKNYFVIYFETNPIFITSKHNYKIFGTSYNFKHQGEILAKLSELSYQVTDEEREDIWHVNNGELYLLPCIFTSTNHELYLMDHFYDETSLYYDTKNFIINDSDGNISLKLKGQCKISNKLLVDQYDFSKSLIDLWITNYKEFHGHLPFIVDGDL